MKKWMIICGLLLFFTGLCMSGHSAEVRYKEPLRSNLSVNISKKIFANDHPCGGAQGDYKRIQLTSRSTAPVISSFFLAERFYQVPCSLYRQQQTVAPAKKEIVGDRLQHLFPFHYFW